MRKLRDLTSPIYKYDHGKRDYVPYTDMQGHFQEMNERLEESEETATFWRKKYRLLCLQVNTVNELAMHKNEHMRGIDAEPEWKLLLKYADFGSSENEPVSQDYDAMRDLANENRETGTLPW